jgi:hypothetical protein
MKTVRELHHEAMKLDQLAEVARWKGEHKRAKTLEFQAYQYEAKAANLVAEEYADDRKTSEPTRSILYLSAASLAYQCKAFKAARHLIVQGLLGFPSGYIKQGLEDLYNAVEKADVPFVKTSTKDTNDTASPLHDCATEA